MTSTHYVIIDGHLPRAVAELLDQRFDDLRVCRRRHQSLLECTIADQPALRALVTQVWDVGATLLLLADIAAPGRNGTAMTTTQAPSPVREDAIRTGRRSRGTAHPTTGCPGSGCSWSAPRRCPSQPADPGAGRRLGRAGVPAAVHPHPACPRGLPGPGRR